MHLGLKLWSTNDFYIAEAERLYADGVFAYIELFTVPESFNFIERWKRLDIPFVIHAPHSLAGFNPADIQRREENLRIMPLVDAYRYALNPKYIIFHPGLNGCVHEAVLQFNSIFDEYHEIQKIALLENKPARGLNNEECVGSIPEQITVMLNSTNMRFCLDVGHAICSAKSIGIEPFSMIDDFLKLNPVLFHLSDGFLNSEMDAHHNYGRGDYPISEILASLPDASMITIETEKNDLSSLDDFAQDARFLRVSMISHSNR